MELAKKENNKYNKKSEHKNIKLKDKDNEPVWFNKDIKREEITEEEEKELDELLKDFR